MRRNSVKKWRVEVSQTLSEEEDRWGLNLRSRWENKAKKVLRVASGRRKQDTDTWWWNGGAHDSISRKKQTKKNL